MSHHNTQVVQSVYEAFGKGDLPAVLAAFDPQIEIVEAESLPYAGVYRGHGGVSQLMQTIGDVWEVFDVSMERLVAHDDEVIALLQIKARLRGSARPLEMPVVEVWKLRDGKVLGIRPFYWDTAAIARAWAERVVPV